MSNEKKRIFETQTGLLNATQPVSHTQPEGKRKGSQPQGKGQVRIWNTFSRDLVLRLINSIKDV